MSDLTIPISADELEEMLNDQKQLQALMAEPDKFGEFITNYARTVLNKDADLGKQLTEQTQQMLGNYLREHGADLRRINLTDQANLPWAPRNRAERRLYNRRAPGASLDQHFDGSAEFFQAVWHKRDSLRNRGELSDKLHKIQEIQNSFGSTVPADGGFLIPENLRAEILSVALESSVVRSRARVIPMETLRVPIPAIDSTSNVSSVFGGIVCYWTEEGAALTESQASFARVVLDAKKLTGYAEMPNELIADATAFGAFFDQVFPQAMAWYEDDAFLNGSGVGEPLGVLNGSGLVTVTQAGGTPDIVPADLFAMYARMLPSSLNSAVWVASIDTFPALASMELSSGSQITWLNNGIAGAPPMSILGRPVIFTEKVPAVTNAKQLNFIDFSYYLIGDRQAMQAESSPHYKFANDKTAFRIIERVDGRPWLNSAITPKNNGSTLSPYVSLGATQ